jgi:hypothetical protein
MNRPPQEPIRGTLPPHVARYMILFVGALVAIGPLSLDAYLPAMPSMADAFHVGIVRINNTISIYLVAYGIGQFFGGAFSDQIGRKRIGLIGLSIFVLASLAIAFSTTAEEVQWLRFVQAIGGGFSTVICMAIVRDVYHVDELGRRPRTRRRSRSCTPRSCPRRVRAIGASSPSSRRCGSARRWSRARTPTAGGRSRTRSRWRSARACS